MFCIEVSSLRVELGSTETLIFPHPSFGALDRLWQCHLPGGTRSSPSADSSRSMVFTHMVVLCFVGTLFRYRPLLVLRVLSFPSLHSVGG